MLRALDAARTARMLRALDAARTARMLRALDAASRPEQLILPDFYWQPLQGEALWRSE